MRTEKQNYILATKIKETNKTNTLSSVVLNKYAGKAFQKLSGFNHMWNALLVGDAHFSFPPK